MKTPLATSRQEARGQIIVIAALAMIAMIAFGALILEGGNAFAQQRVVQNGSDAIANAGAVRLGQRLAGVATTDTDIQNVMNASANANHIDIYTAVYTDVAGKFLDAIGNIVASRAAAAQVGGAIIPPGAQGVSPAGTRTFPTFFGRALGFDSFKASADATAVTGRLVGGAFLPIVIPVSIVDCETNGNLGSVPDNEWVLSQPPVAPATTPNGIEYIIPLCKTGGGSFQILDLDPSLRCDEEVANPPNIFWPVLPVDVPSDNGNNCAKPITDYVNANLRYKTVLVPICDNSPPDPCGTQGGSHATYRIIRVAAFFIDYMDDSNNKNNSNCQSHVSGTGQQLVTIAGNGSSSCIAGWFVRYIKNGPVGAGTITNDDAIGVQLIH